MAREFGRWFRFYDGVLDDPKVQRLPDKLFRAWVNLMCLASRSGGRIEADYAAIGFSLRISEAQARDTLKALASAGLMDIEKDGIAPHNWTERQFKTDGDDPTGAVRQKRWRERNRNGPVTDDRNGKERDTTVTVKRPDTEHNRTETETDPEAKASAVASAPAAGPSASKPNFQKLSFDEGVALGIARPAIGRMAKLAGEDWTAVHGVLSRCAAHKASKPDLDPTSWCMAEFQPHERAALPQKSSLAERLTAKIGA